MEFGKAMIGRGEIVNPCKKPLAFSIDFRSGAVTQRAFEDQGEPIAINRYLQSARHPTFPRWLRPQRLGQSFLGTCHPPHRSAGAQVCLRRMFLSHFADFCEVAESTGLEPATSAVTGRRSNQLS